MSSSFPLTGSSSALEQVITFDDVVVDAVQIHILLFMALPGRGGRALWCRTGFRGRAESGEHLGSRSEARRDPVYGQLHFVRPRECRLLAGEQRRSFREGSVQAALGDMPGEVAQRLKKPLSLSFDLLMFPSIQLFFILSSLFILWGSLFILFFYSWMLFVVWFTFTALRLLNQFWKRPPEITAVTFWPFGVIQCSGPHI